ncbi:hypothetical protein C0J52_18484 [Blattella germanica]|nr:hypothetical protein C0J52_18484 [Blattella germanica]
MGACFGRCFNIKSSKPYRSQRTMYFQGEDNVEVPPHESKPTRGKKIPQEVTLELTDDTWPTRKERTSRTTISRQQPSSSAVVDVPLQPLDARSLLAARAVLQATNQREKSIASSTPPRVAEEEGCESATTNGASAAGSTAWSRISTPDSLEWDPVEAPLATANDRAVEELDAETEQLLSEIERLTSRALRETGDWSS